MNSASNGNTIEDILRIIREGAERNAAAHQEFLERQRAYEERHQDRQREYEERQGAFEERGKHFDERMAVLAERMITFEMGMAESREQHYHLVAANNRSHDEFEAEFRRLLTAQVLLNESLTKTNEAAAELVESGKKADKRLEILEVKMAETTDKLNALIDTVQKQRNNGNPPAQ